MAQQQRRQVQEIGYKQLQLFKCETLGVGSYGSVCKARYDDLLCAAKIIHPTLFDPIAEKQIESRMKHRLPFQRFVQECEFLKAIRHPNIVQYLGVEQDPETCLLVLLMELMDDSLTHFLEVSQGPVPYHIQLNLCHDITQALSFLHSNAIIHRDLSSNNVLLIGDIRAKVTDFGMAKLGDMNPQATHNSNTMCPGTDVYMPPEAVKENPYCTYKMDSFSFGVIAIQILTQEFPKPGDRQKTIHVDHPRFPTAQVNVPEIKRRQNHISKIDPKHPILPIALYCLKDRDVERPSAHELCHKLAALKETPQHIDSERMTRETGTLEQARAAELERQIRELLQQREEDETQMKEVIANERQENQVLREKVREKERELQQVNQKLELCQQSLAQFQKRSNKLEVNPSNSPSPTLPLTPRKSPTKDIPSIQVQTQSLTPHNLTTLQDQAAQPHDQSNPDNPPAKQEPCLDSAQAKPVDPLQAKSITPMQVQVKQDSPVMVTKQRRKLSFPWKRNTTSQQPPGIASAQKLATKRVKIEKLVWKTGIENTPCAMIRGSCAVNGSMVYINTGDSRGVFSFDSTGSTPRWSQLPDCPFMYASLVVVNGLLTAVGGRGEDGNRLVSFEGHQGKWEERFPRMLTRRHNTVVVCCGTTLVVAGGKMGLISITTVEIMDTHTLQWSTAASLPVPIDSWTGSVCTDGDRVYIADSSQLYLCTLRALRDSESSKTKRFRSAKRKQAIWSHKPLPHENSTLVSLTNQVLAVGGGSLGRPRTCAVQVYCQHTNSWKVVDKGQMNEGRSKCLAAELPGDQLFVAGGVGWDTDSQSERDVVTYEIAK